MVLLQINTKYINTSGVEKRTLPATPAPSPARVPPVFRTSAT